MKYLNFSVVGLLILMWASCQKDASFFMQDDPNLNSSAKYLAAKKESFFKAKATGGIEVEYKGNSTEKRAFAEFNAFDQEEGDKGTFEFNVRSNGKIHRQITAKLSDVLVDFYSQKAWFIGEVVDDTKACGDHGGGPGSGGHDDGEECDHEDGGGCDHDDGDVSHEDGHDEGCDSGDSDHGSGGSGTLSGKNCRIGQIIVVKVHDVATPGTKGDGITWKWFAKDGGMTPHSTDNVAQWPHLCKKDIIGGNLVVHDK